MASQAEVLDMFGKMIELYDADHAPSTDGYVWALEDIPCEFMLQALRQWVKNSAWLPKPAELRETALQLQKQALDDQEMARQDLYSAELAAGRQAWIAATGGLSDHDFLELYYAGKIELPEEILTGRVSLLVPA